MKINEGECKVYSDTKNRKRFLKEIQQKRDQMIYLGKRYGLTNEKTITCSQELDELLNEYHYLFQHQAEKPNVIREVSFHIYRSQLKKSNWKVKKYQILKAI